MACRSDLVILMLVRLCPLFSYVLQMLVEQTINSFEMCGGYNVKLWRLQVVPRCIVDRQYCGGTVELTGRLGLTILIWLVDLGIASALVLACFLCCCLLYCFVILHFKLFLVG